MGWDEEGFYVTVNTSALFLTAYCIAVAAFAVSALRRWKRK